MNGKPTRTLSDAELATLVAALPDDERHRLTQALVAQTPMVTETIRTTVTEITRTWPAPVPAPQPQSQTAPALMHMLRKYGKTEGETLCGGQGYTQGVPQGRAVTCPKCRALAR